MALLPQKITFSTALSVSLAIHAVVLAVHFDLPEALMHEADRTLEVILVNSKSARRPSDAQALAQANLDGGGNTEENRIAKTPLPASQRNRTGDNLVEMQRRVAAKEAEMRQLLAQMRSARTMRSEARHSEAVEPQPPQPVNGLDLANNALAIARLQGQIDRQTEEYNKRPRKKFIGARTAEYRFARYVEDMLQKIERVGSLNYPEAARGKVSGSLILTIEVRSNGDVVSVTIDKPSGKKVLDDAARRIVQLAGPYAAFPPSIADTDILTVTRHWNFINGSNLQVN